MAMIQCPECMKDVSDSATMCPNCGYSVKEHFYREKMTEQRTEFLAKKAERNKIVKKHLKIWLPICSIIVLLVIALTVNHMVLSERTTFKSKEEMLEFLMRTNWKLDNDYREEYIVFSETGFAECVSESWSRGDIIEMHPKRGYFEFYSSKYIILENGQLYEKGNIGEDYYNTWRFSPLLETVSETLELSIDNLTCENGTITGKMHLTNKGENEYEHLEANIVAYDNENNSIEHETLSFKSASSKSGYTVHPGDVASTDIYWFDVPSDFTPVKYEAYISSYSTPLN